MRPAFVNLLVRLVAILILFSGLILHAEDLALTGATVYPSPDTKPIPDAVVLIHGKEIAAIGSRSSVRIPKDVRVIDCSGKFITAGFWNSHVHLFTPVLLRARAAKADELNK